MNLIAIIKKWFCRHECTMDKHSFDEFSERELEDMIRRGIVLCIE